MIKVRSGDSSTGLTDGFIERSGVSGALIMREEGEDQRVWFSWHYCLHCCPMFLHGCLRLGSLDRAAAYIRAFEVPGDGNLDKLTKLIRAALI